jgi:acyl-coenzyme A thioesterase PaaI-like protein
MKFEDHIAQAKASGDPARLAEEVPFAAFLGLSLELDDEGLFCKVVGDEKLIGNPTLPALHGGVLGSLLESAAIFLLIWEIETPTIPKTINMSFDYLRSGPPVDTFARGVVTKQGRRVANVRVEAWQDDASKPIAAAHGHFLLA